MSTVAEALQLAVGHHRANRLAQAKQVYRKILETHPNQPDALQGLGVLTQQVGQHQAAEKLLSAALQVQPQSVKAWFSLGNLRQAQGQLPEAAEAYQRALAIQPDSVAVHNNLGYTWQLQGQWEEALACYRRALDLDPDCAEAEVNLGNALHAQGKLSPDQRAYYAEANHELGVAQKKQGNLTAAVAYYRQALALNPDWVRAHNNLGIAFQEQSQFEEALGSYQKALALAPDSALVHNNLGNVLWAQGKLEEATTSYQRALALQPDLFEACINLGHVLKKQKKWEEALTAYHQALALKPDYPEVHKVYKGLGDVRLGQDQLDEAIAAYHQALALKPNYLEAENNLGMAFLAKDSYEQASAIFHRLFWKNYGTPWGNAARFDPAHPVDLEGSKGFLAASPRQVLSASRFKLTDRIDQLNYLLANGKLDPSFQACVTRYQLLLQELEAQFERVPSIPLNRCQLERFAGYYDKVVYYADAPRLAGATMNDSLDYRALEDSYLASSMVCFDNFLTPEALEGLRQFCLESTIYFGHSGQSESDPGFLGAYMAEGFNCPLLYQFIAELKRRLPRVLGALPLVNMWVYRYGNRGSGVKTHTGDGSVTINFWITPDEANLDPGGGGLVIYKKEQPLDWDWLKYNLSKDDPDTQAKIDEFLASADSVTIPYRCNRAVLFHSTLFHRSDPFHFRDSFENRRMNVTMLFGHRGRESALLE